MKPYFTPPFGASLPTRIGKLVGRAKESVLLAGAGGPNGIEKAFIRNPDGSTTMLKTRAGMPQFSTPRARAASITVSNETAVVVGDIFIVNAITVPGGGVYTLVYIDGGGLTSIHWGELLNASTLSNGVTIASGPEISGTSVTYTVTVPQGVTSFSAGLDLTGGDFNDSFSGGYTLNVSNNALSGSGGGAVISWCTVHRVPPEDPGYNEWARRCI